MTKKGKKLGVAHTSSSPKGIGDFYGTGIRAKIGKMRGDSVGMIEIPVKGLKKPPRNLA